jgi:diadenosine tetraphosphatase ApaH/serine/threonine PP2A family protein phosphatase
VVIAGDLVGRGPNPVEVLRLIRGRGFPVIRGNVERKLLESRPGSAKQGSAKSLKKNLRWTADCLGASEWKFLEALPAEIRLDFAGCHVRVVHGSPTGDEDYVFPSITAAALAARLGAERPDVLVCGHTHLPFTRSLAGVRVINCGSVGSPYDGDPRGAFCLADFAPNTPMRSRIVRFEYPVERVMDDLTARRVPGPDPLTYQYGVRSVK